MEQPHSQTKTNPFSRFIPLQDRAALRRKAVRTFHRAIPTIFWIAFLVFFAAVVALAFFMAPYPTDATIPAPPPRHAVSPALGVPNPCGLDVVVCDKERAKGRVEAQAKPYGAVEARIRAIAKAEGYLDADHLVRLAKCESGLNPLALGDGGYNSRGLFQISAYFHPGVTDDQAFSIDFSTRWTIKQLKAGRDSLWTCSQLID